MVFCCGFSFFHTGTASLCGGVEFHDCTCGRLGFCEFVVDFGRTTSAARHPHHSRPSSYQSRASYRSPPLFRPSNLFLITSRVFSGSELSTPRLAHVPWTPPHDESLDESISETSVLGTAAKASTLLAGLPSRPHSAYFHPLHSIRLVGYCRLCRSRIIDRGLTFIAVLTFQAHSFTMEIPHRARLVGATSNCNRSLMLASSNAKKLMLFGRFNYLAVISNGIHRCQKFWIVVVGFGGHFLIDPSFVVFFYDSHTEEMMALCAFW